jgi:hypothetical protein
MASDAFRVHRLNGQGLQQAQRIADAFDELLIELDAVLWRAGADERAEVVKQLQIACFLAKRAMAQDPANQE